MFLLLLMFHGLLNGCEECENLAFKISRHDALGASP